MGLQYTKRMGQMQGSIQREPVFFLGTLAAFGSGFAGGAAYQTSSSPANMVARGIRCTVCEIRRYRTFWILLTSLASLQNARCVWQ